MTGIGEVMFLVKMLSVRQSSTPIRPREEGWAQNILLSMARSTPGYGFGGIGIWKTKRVHYEIESDKTKVRPPFLKIGNANNFLITSIKYDSCLGDRFYHVNNIVVII